MMDTSLVLSLFAFIFSLISVIIVIIKLGLSLEINFVEKKEIQDIKEKIEKKLKDEWEEKLSIFISNQIKNTRDVGKGVLEEEIADLGNSVRHTQIGSILLSVVSKLSSNISRYVRALFLITIGLIFSAWYLITNPDNFLGSISGNGQNWWVIPIFLIFFLSADIYMLNKNIKNYNSLRRQFYELGVYSSLLKAKEIFDSLEEERFIYG